MMKGLNAIIENLRDLSLSEIYEFWNNQKDIFIIKHDGESENNKFTIIIVSSESKFESIRWYSEDIYTGLEGAFKGYRVMLEKHDEENLPS